MMKFSVVEMIPVVGLECECLRICDERMRKDRMESSRSEKDPFDDDF